MNEENKHLLGETSAPEFRQIQYKQDQDQSFPNYKNINFKLLSLMSLIYFFIQAQTSFQSFIFQYSETGQQIISMISFAIQSFIAVVTNIVFSSFSDTALIIISIILAFISTMLCIACYGFMALQQSVLIEIYFALVMIIGNMSQCILSIGSFSFMLKCMQIKSSNGIIISIAMSESVLGYNIIELLCSYSFMTLTNYIIVLYVTAVILIVLCFVCNYMPVPSFHQLELDINQICINNRTNNIKTVIQYTDDENSSGSNKGQHNWLKFYKYMLFESLNGTILLMQSISELFNNQQANQLMMDQQWMQPNCLPQQFSVYQGICYENLHSTAFLILIPDLVQVCVFFITCYLFDAVELRIQNKQTSTMLIYSIYTFLQIFSTLTSSLASSTGMFYINLQLYLSLVTSSMNIIIIRLNIITLFSGGYRVAICFVQTYVYIFQIFMGILFLFQIIIDNMILCAIQTVISVGCCWVIMMSSR